MTENCNAKQTNEKMSSIIACIATYTIITLKQCTELLSRRGEARVGEVSRYGHGISAIALTFKKLSYRVWIVSVVNNEAYIVKT